MRLVVKTERGSFVGIHSFNGEVEQLLKRVASGEAEYFMLETTKGKVILGKALLTKAAFILEKDTDAKGK